ncbi:MAG: DUF6452 family protein [Lepagella sp.]
MLNRHIQVLKATVLTAVVLLLLVGMGGCGDACSENKNALPLAGFYSKESPGSEISVDSLEIKGVDVKGDSILSSADKTISEVYLPFRIDSDTTRYALRRYGPYAGIDTLTFIYNRRPQLASIECGVSYIFEMIDIQYGGELIDSVSCPKGYIDNTNIRNLQIFLKGVTTEQEPW